ncbi:PAS domain S-box protein [Fodinibius halophilus]|uniref:histidine kinase n=1 Tax=Fodinibius halophilus TaxID=1736908 RepID=A0A6M1SSC7_9BACT|nr:PAS domain S-box protein [Fodinibius halophilus]NGP86828.1 PAS domain S-box protein [Fodinibius halophilus]
MYNSYRLLLISNAKSEIEQLQSLLSSLDLQIAFEVISEKDQLIDNIDHFRPDVIVSKYSFPGYSGMDAFRLIQNDHSDIPFILIADSLDEDEVVDLMLEGISDFVKKDNLERLLPAVKREVQNYREQKKKEEQLTESLKRYQDLVQSVDGIVWEADAKTFEFNYVSPQSEEILGYSPSEWCENSNFWKNHIHPDDREKAVTFCHHKTKKGENHSFEYRMMTSDGNEVWLRDYVTVVREEGEPTILRGLMVDITEHKYLSEIDHLENHLANMIIDPDTSLKEILDFFIDRLEEIFPQMIPSIVKIKDDKIYNWSASDRLSEQYLDVINGVAIGPDVGACGTAAFLKEKVIVSDIANDVRWQESRDVALESGLQACWSQPLVNSADKVIGTFAIYYEEPKEPVRFEEKVINRAKNILQVLIENKRSEKALEQKQKLLDKAYQLADIGHWEFNLKEDQLFWSASVKKIHEVPSDYTPDLESAIHFYKKGMSRQTIKRIIDNAIETGEGFDVELEIVTAKGNNRWVRTVGEAEFKNGKCHKIYGSAQEITTRKKAELKLRNTRQKLTDIVEHSTNMFYRHDQNHVLSYVSPQSEEFLGYKPEEAKRKWTEFATDHPINEEGFEKTQKAIDTGESQSPFELQLKKRDGEKIWVQVNEAPIVEDGETVAIVGSLTDITERKEYEEKLEELALVASKTTDCIFMTDPNERITWVNNAFEQVLGYQFEEVVGKAPGNILRGPDNNQQKMNRISKAFKKRRPFQEVVLNYSKTGEKYWFDLTLDPIFDNNGDCDGFIGIQKDVTEQVKRQKELKESVERYEIVSKATSDTIWDYDLEEDVNRYSSNLEKIFGYKDTEVKNPKKWWRDKIHPEDYSRVIEQIEQALSSNKDRFQMEYRFRSYDGVYKFIYDRAFIVSDEQGKPIRMIGAMQDVTRQKAEKKWLKLFESAVSNTTESVAILQGEPTDDIGRKILYVNEAFKKMTGYSSEEILGNTLDMLIGPESDGKQHEKVKHAVENWQPVEAEFLNYKKDGEAFWVRISLAPVQDEEGLYSHWICVGRNITDRRERENELRESLNEKEILLMEIHHRVKNNLAVVSGMMQLQAYEAEDEDLKQKLFDSVVRIKTMGSIHELLYKSESFSKLQLDKNIKRLISDITETFKTNTDLNLQFNMDEVILNINQAIPCSLIVNEVVTNVLKHAYKNEEEGMLKVELNEEEDRIYLNVEDSGKGLPEDFNTNTNGSSLGVQLIETLSNQLEADYTYKSTGNGTLFTIAFKRTEIKGIGSAHLA